jgi:hypothetical protein
MELFYKSRIQVAIFAGILTGLGVWFGTARAESINSPIFTQDQADLGRSSYMVDCASCHKADLSGDRGPALGGQTFKTNWGKHTVADLFTYMKGMMPLCDGASLADSEYLDILAFLLSANGAGAGHQELTPSANVMINDVITSKSTAPANKQ